jgi:hypothetical protein
MSPSLTLFASGMAFVGLAAAVGVRAEGGQIVDKATGARFEEITQEEGQRFKCLGAGVRKLMIANVYAVAFCVDAAHADALVESYVAQRHEGLQGEALFKTLRDDREFFQRLAATKHNRIAVLKMQRNLSQKQLATNIRRSLSSLLPDEKLDKLTAAITAGAEKGQVVKIFAIGPKLTVDVAGAARTFVDEEITSKLFFVWLGSKSVSPTLREDIARRAARLP